MKTMLPRYVVEATAQETGVLAEVLRGRCKCRQTMAARKLLYFATPECGLSMSAMARYLNRDPSTVCQVINSNYLLERERALVEAIKATAHEIAMERQRKFKEAAATGMVVL